MMHHHISWATAFVALLSYIVTVGALNMLAQTYANNPFARAWSHIASPI